MTHPEFPLLQAAVRRDGESLVVAASPIGMRVRTTDPIRWQHLLGLLDGRRRVEDAARIADLDPGDVAAVVSDLTLAGLVVDSDRRWLSFHRESSNPRRTDRTSTTDPYSLPRWAPPHDADQTTLQVRDDLNLVADLEKARRSFDRVAPDRIDAVASESAALACALGSYREVDGCRRPVASAGGLEPIHLLVNGAREAESERRILYPLGDASTVVELGRQETADVVAWFVADGVIERVVAQGAAVILICGDPTRSVGKYGDRGWRYVLMEAGGVAHSLGLHAAEVGAHARLVGGFYDAVVEHHTCGLVPLLACVIYIPAGDESRH